ncbi:MAG: type II toxin-antitoxin system HicB family antitoxin [Beijerinckiaceae bacterium]|nr:type II toxin-antitoxin system HicB family antitoxin [Beijerinckiaceae bacterium]
MSWYVARIANQDGAHAVRFPDAPDVCVNAATLEDALERAAQTLNWRIEELRAKGVPAPRATPLSAFGGAVGSTTPIYALVEIADAADAPATAPLTRERHAPASVASPISRAAIP